MDVLKDAFEAMAQRIRSPIVGSIVLSFFVINWKAVAYLLFADHPLLVRFAFWDGNTSVCSLYFGPLVVGIALAFALPWTKFGGAWLAQIPTVRLKILQAEAAREIRISEANGQRREEQAIQQLIEQREDAAISEEERLIEARSVSNELGERLVNIRREAKETADETTPSHTLSQNEIAALELLENKEIEARVEKDPFSAYETKFPTEIQKKFVELGLEYENVIRIQTEFNTALLSLTSKRLVEHNVKMVRENRVERALHVYRVTSHGYAFLDNTRKGEESSPT